MTAKRVTLDDLKDRAEAIQETVKEDARAMVAQETTKMVVAGAVVVAVAVSVAFYLGTRRCRY